MARDVDIDRMLWLWAEALKCGDGSGYPVKCTIHPDWSPPAPGTTPTMKISSASAASASTGRMVAALSATLRATVVAKYLLRMADADIAQATGCAIGTVSERIGRAHREMLAMLAGG